MSVSPIGGSCRPGPGTHCRTCSLSSLCLPLALNTQAMEDFDAIIKRRAPLVRGEVLCRQGETFTQIFAVRSGSFKQVVLDQDGEEQISHFHLPGELMGLESIEEGSHAGFIIALERSTACEIPFHQLDTLAERMPELRNQLYRSMSRVMSDEHRLIRLLTCKSADERMASFLLDLARRFERYGYSPERFRLPMSRNRYRQLSGARPRNGEPHSRPVAAAVPDSARGSGASHSAARDPLSTLPDRSLPDQIHRRPPALARRWPLRAARQNGRHLDKLSVPLSFL